MFRVNFRKIGEELCTAKEIETKYCAENNAKFRAIEQQVASYDEFRGIVLTSHLKPLDKRYEDTGKFKYNWNTCSNISNEFAYRTSFVQSKDIEMSINDHSISADFMDMWNKMKMETSSKYHFIINFDPALFRKRISVGLNPDILGDLIVTLDNEYKHEDASRIYRILSIISSLNNFKLLKHMLTIQEKYSIQSLGLKLKSVLCSEDLCLLGNMFT